MTATSAVTSPSSDLLSGEDRQMGPAYDFTVAKEPSPALISFTVDPAKLAASTGVPGASPAGLYIQIYEPALGSWIPLESTDNQSKHTVTDWAVTRHPDLTARARSVQRFSAERVGIAPGRRPFPGEPAAALVMLERMGRGRMPVSEPVPD